jgi:hypothetical protein
MFYVYFGLRQASVANQWLLAMIAAVRPGLMRVWFITELGLRLDMTVGRLGM